MPATAVALPRRRESGGSGAVARRLADIEDGLRESVRGIPGELVASPGNASVLAEAREEVRLA